MDLIELDGEIDSTWIDTGISTTSTYCIFYVEIHMLFEEDIERVYTNRKNEENG